MWLILWSKGLVSLRCPGKIIFFIIIIWQGSLEVNPSVLIVFFSCWGFRHANRFRGNGHSLYKFKTNMARMPYNKLLTNLASSSRAGEYWPLVVLERTRLCSVRTATTSGQYNPVWPSRSVSIYFLALLFCWRITSTAVLWLQAVTLHGCVSFTITLQKHHCLTILFFFFFLLSRESLSARSTWMWSHLLPVWWGR